MNKKLSYEELLNSYNNQQHIINNQQQMLNRLSKPTNNIDPYKILNISKNYDLNSLKKAYIREAMIHHPDKGGDPVYFKKVIISYKVLLKKYSNNSNSDHTTLKIETEKFNESQISNNLKNLSLDKKFNKTKFNETFDKNKINTVYDDGYGDWYNHSTETKPQFNNKVGQSTFHSAFEKRKKEHFKKNKNQLMKKDPLENISYKGADSIMVLGQGKVENFGGSSNGLHFYDLKKAYDDNYISDSTESIQDRTIDSVERDRGDISYKMSKSDLQIYNDKKLHIEKEEKYRLNNVDTQDDMASKLYDQIHGRLIGNT